MVILYYFTKSSFLGATIIVQNVLDKPNALTKHLLEPFERILTAGDQSFLKNFLASNDLKNVLTVSHQPDVYSVIISSHL